MRLAFILALQLLLIDCGAALQNPCLRPSMVGRSAQARVTMLDVTPSVAKQFQNNVAGAVLVDKTVTAAFEELKINEQALTELGEPIKIEQCVGAGVQPNGDVKVRVFIIFTKSGGASSYSCNVSATGKPIEGGGVEIIKLSCAKDEGWGRTIDVI